MPKLRRESIAKVVEKPYIEEEQEEPLFRHGQAVLNENTCARIAELVATTPAEGVTYWNFKTLTERVSRTIKA
jgi:hypothetical protein